MPKLNNKNNFQMKKRRKGAMPDAFIIIFGIVVLAAIMTYILPSGTYERQEMDGVTEVVPDSYETIESSPASFFDVFHAIPRGLVDTADLIFMVLIIGGVVAVIERTGAINASINSLIRLTKGNKKLLIASVCLIFGTICTVGVAANVVIAFIPIGIALARSLKLDAITGVAIIYLGYFGGNVAGVLDPAILGLAQKISELPLFSGITLRAFVFAVLMLATIIYIYRYANKISKDPSKSIMGASALSNQADSENAYEENNDLFSGKHFFVILTFALFIGIFLFGSFQYDWGITELSAIFIIMGVVIAAIDRINPNEFIRIFSKGAQSIVYGALVIGLARAVIFVLEDGQIMDTIVHGAIIPLSSMPTFLGSQMLYFFNLLFNILVPSGTGQAAIVMPLIVPIVDMLDITRQTGVLALKLGDGISNIITPTSGVLMATLAVGGVSWIKWFKFVFPIFLIWTVIGAVFMGIATFIGYGPF